MLTNTGDRNEFMKALEKINSTGAGDCPDLTLSGIELGLQQSKRYSNILVYTDAIAKDLHLYERVKKLALDSNSKVKTTL